MCIIIEVPERGKPDTIVIYGDVFLLVPNRRGHIGNLHHLLRTETAL
jgi:hypothetical protein